MNKLAELKKRLAALKKEGQDIVAAAEASESGEFTEAQEDRFAALEEEIGEVQAAIAAQEKLAERRRTMGASTSLTPAGHTTVRDQDPETTAGFKDIGEFAVAVHGAVQANRVGGSIDQRL
ncbi:hypothetical protein, partial [Roseivivax isoporae]|uniref:hypothetical protein n=1 Tax=Roseivivax isoporae TaxID=591206 RepID=UPI0005C1E74E